MHRIHWEYTRCSEFDGCKVEHDEVFDSWEAANDRLRELMFDSHQKEHTGPTYLVVRWYDDEYEDDGIEPLYRKFEMYVPDRG
jgi:hypothetical protein